MKTAIVALTVNGAALAGRLASKLKADVYVKAELVEDLNTQGENALPTDAGITATACNSPVLVFTQLQLQLENELQLQFEDKLQTELDKGSYRIIPIEGKFTELAGMLFENYQQLVFIMATGIVVRAIAPYLKSKTCDPAVVVMDEKGKHVISLLSGHLGGANRLAAKISSITGAEPVITTATDVNDVVAFDMSALDNDYVIENIEVLKYISGQLVNGGKVRLYSDYEIKGNMPLNIEFTRLTTTDDGICENCSSDDTSLKHDSTEKNAVAVLLTNRIIKFDNKVEAVNNVNIKSYSPAALYLRPKNLILGIGCRKGVSAEAIEQAVQDFMKVNGRSLLSIKCVATVDLKKDEKGILDYCSKQDLKLLIVSRQAIAAVETTFSSSQFVKDSIGVSSVCEPCSVLAVPGAKLLCPKTVYKGITLALSEETRDYYI